jgi:demethylmenaquinone methyltransferase/2-methoxy-6-polyprenyl-1,4-benzoquinol methylase
MFDQVSSRYDLLNRIMTLGRDRAWREAMWDEVPESARAVLDLCTGSGTSLSGLRRPGRLVLGMDVSLGMLEIAASSQDRAGWAPRLVCADAFRLPLRDGSLDCVTIAFGVRNLRPRVEALAEIARALTPAGTLVVLEAAAARPGPLAWLHSFYLERMIPLAGRLSPEPSAYRYLSRSIVEFGSGTEFEADLARAGFVLTGRRSFLLGAARLWTARRPGVPTRSLGPAREAPAEGVHPARLGELPRGVMPNRNPRHDPEWCWWTGAQLVLSAVLLASLGYALWVFSKSGASLPLEGWQRPGLRILLAAGVVGFFLRTVVLWFRFRGSPRRR